jgi:hypothetical protein
MLAVAAFGTVTAHVQVKEGERENELQHGKGAAHAGVFVSEMV